MAKIAKIEKEPLDALPNDSELCVYDIRLTQPGNEAGIMMDRIKRSGSPLLLQGNCSPGTGTRIDIKVIDSNGSEIGSLIKTKDPAAPTNWDVTYTVADLPNFPPSGRFRVEARHSGHSEVAITIQRFTSVA